MAFDDAWAAIIIYEKRTMLPVLATWENVSACRANVTLQCRHGCQIKLHHLLNIRDKGIQRESHTRRLDVRETMHSRSHQQ